MRSLSEVCGDLNDLLEFAFLALSRANYLSAAMLISHPLLCLFVVVFMYHGAQLY